MSICAETNRIVRYVVQITYLSLEQIACCDTLFLPYLINLFLSPESFWSVQLTTQQRSWSGYGIQVYIRWRMSICAVPNRIVRYVVQITYLPLLEDVYLCDG